MLQLEKSKDLAAAQTSLQHFAYNLRKSSQLPAEVFDFMRQNPTTKLEVPSWIVPRGYAHVEVVDSFFTNGMVHVRAYNENSEPDQKPRVITLTDITVCERLYFSFYTGLRIDPSTELERSTYGDSRMFNYARALATTQLADRLTDLEKRVGSGAPLTQLFFGFLRADVKDN